MELKPFQNMDPLRAAGWLSDEFYPVIPGEEVVMIRYLILIKLNEFKP